MPQAEPPEQPPDRAGIDPQAALRFQSSCDLTKGHLWFGLDLLAQPICVRCQLANANIALALRGKPPCFALQLDHIVDELDRDIKTLGR